MILAGLLFACLPFVTLLFALRTEIESVGFKSRLLF